MATGIHSVSAETGYEITPTTSGIEMKWDGTAGEFYAIARPAGTYAAITARGAWTFTDALVLSGDLTVGDDLVVTDQVTFSAMTIAGFVKNNSSGVLSGGNSVDISSDTNLAVTAPITLTGDTLAFSHNTTNLQITATELNTIQDIATSSSPTFASMTLTGNLTINGATSVNVDSATNAYYRADRGANTDLAGLRYLTAGTEKWFAGMKGDSTEDWRLATTISGTDYIHVNRGTGLITTVAAMTIGTDLTVTDDCTVVGDFLHDGSGSFTATNATGGMSFLVMGETNANTVSFRGYRASSVPVSTLMRFDGARGDLTTPAVVSGDLSVVQMIARGHDGVSAFQNSSAIYLMTGTGSFSATSMPGRISFYTCPDASVTLTEAMRITQNQDVRFMNKIVDGTDDTDSFLDLSMGSGDVQLAAARDLYLDIDSDNNATGRSLIVRHNSATTLFQVEDDGDVLIPVGDLYLNDRIISDATANTFIDFATDLTLAGRGNVIVDIDNDASGTLAYFGITQNNGGTTLFQFNEDGDALCVVGSLHTQAVGETVYVKRATGAEANKTRGTATLVGGTVTVSTTAIASNDLVLVSKTTAGGTEGHIRYSIVAATSFTLTSSSGTDTSTFEWWIVKQS